MPIGKFRFWAHSRRAPDFVLICAWRLDFVDFLDILDIEESITYLFSIVAFDVPCYKTQAVPVTKPKPCLFQNPSRACFKTQAVLVSKPKPCLFQNASRACFKTQAVSGYKTHAVPVAKPGRALMQNHTGRIVSPSLGHARLVSARKGRPHCGRPSCHWPRCDYLLVWVAPVASSTAAWAAARRAVSRRNGLQET